MLLCTPILVESVERALRDTLQASEHGADLVEFRIDTFFDPESFAYSIAQMRELVAKSALPCILTCRHAREGGGYDGPEDARVSMYESMCTSDDAPAYIDIELSAYQASANIRQKLRLCVQHPGQLRDVKSKLILSVHDFDRVPSDLARKMHAMMDDSACSIVKVAARARNVLDAVELLEMCRHCTKPAIMLGMGEFGSMSRVLAGKFGGFLTFAPLSREAATAPGQFSLRELTGTFGIRRVRSSSRVYAIVGWPVSASLSPAVHNAAFARRSDDDRIYVHAPIAAHATANDDDAHAAEAGFVATMLELIEQEYLKFSGASVTMPHKASLAKLAIAKGWGRDDAVLATGAANTLVIEGEGPQKRIRVLNTDAGALLHMLQTLAQSRHDRNLKSMQEMSVAIVGAGGVAAAAAWAGAKVGAKVTIFNRTRARADALRTTLERAIPTAQIASSQLHELASVDCDVMVQCTSVGMQHAESAVPHEVFTRLTGPRTFIETIYRPVETTSLLAAKHAGWHVIDGTQLFVKQAELQSAAWLGEMPPDGLFTNIVQNALSSET